MSAAPQPSTASRDFTWRHVPAFGKRVHRLGLTGNYGIDEAGLSAALERGLNYIFWTPRQGRFTRVLREALKRDRERFVISAGPSFGWFPGQVRRGAERALKVLGVDYLDLYQLYWLSRMSAWTEGTVEELVKLKQEGKVRALGVSIHDRPRAGRLAEDSPLDVLMIRYNAAHPGAERDIFPHLEKRKPAIVAYTATDWRKLLKRPSGWEGPVPTAGDCYRFCLSNPHVDVVLNGPASLAQLDENLAALEKGPLSSEEMEWMRRFGQVVHG
ncbi:aldo/keto reductase [Archangium violaceum]|uniref:aldo/keto reductase n=1 Tax=Archangium violaceum TaxID=83451 RepID=UPI00194F2A75|nr:aldo/keto reductase [Archangium violaceum]QRN98796.1 aldo/keto reductase [Archangium violaceum]